MTPERKAELREVHAVGLCVDRIYGCLSCELLDALNDAEARERRLREAGRELRKFVEHQGGYYRDGDVCPRSEDGRMDEPCTCGLSDALAAYDKARKS